jgi:aspartokinase-like uncharacterized kinase
LALEGLRLAAHFLAALLNGAIVIEHLPEAIAGRAYAVLDPYSFTLGDEGHLGSLPHSWSVTSDSVAARVAIVAGARELILLKSADHHEGAVWTRAEESGLVDHYFAQAVRGVPQVKVVNFRRWQ